MAMRENSVEMIEHLMEHGAKVTCCFSCKRGKACQKVPQQLAEWYHSEMKARRKSKRGSNVYRTATSVPKLQITSAPSSPGRHLNSVDNFKLTPPLSARAPSETSEDLSSPNDSPPQRTSFLKRFLTSKSKKKEN